MSNWSEFVRFYGWNLVYNVNYSTINNNHKLWIVNCELYWLVCCCCYYYYYMVWQSIILGMTYLFLWGDKWCMMIAFCLQLLLLLLQLLLLLSLIVIVYKIDKLYKFDENRLYFHKTKITWKFIKKIRLKNQKKKKNKRSTLNNMKRSSSFIIK